MPATPGVGVAAAKSAALFAVFVSSPSRVTDWLFEAPRAGPLPANALAVAPYPTKSTTGSLAGHAAAAQVSAAVVLTRATLPAVPLIAIVPVTLPGTGVVPPVPAASTTTNAAPGWMTPVSGVVRSRRTHPVAEAYWTDQPVRSTGALVGLTSSMKSLVYVAPLFPPPPYTSLIRMRGLVPTPAWAAPAVTTAPVTARARAAMPPLIDFVARRTSGSLSSGERKSGRS